MLGIALPSSVYSQKIAPEVVTPFELSRRLHFRLVGRIPERAEVEQFIADADWNGLVDRLLAHQDNLRVREEFWIDLLNLESPEDLKWIKEQVKANTPIDKRLHSWFAGQRPASKTDEEAFLYLEKTGNNLFGVGYDCTRCHDHPFENVRQKQFLELAGFFQKSGFVHTPKLYYYDDATPGEVIPARTRFGPELRIRVSKRDIEAVRAGKEVKRKIPPAEEFAGWLTNFRDNPQILHAITVAYVDWLWGPHYLSDIRLPGADPMLPPPPEIAEAVRILKGSSYNEETLLRKLSSHSIATEKYPPLKVSTRQWMRSIEAALGKPVEDLEWAAGPDNSFIEQSRFMDQILGDHSFVDQTDLDDIYLRTLSRIPTEEESAKILEALQDTELPVSEIYRNIFLSHEFKSIP